MSAELRHLYVRTGMSNIATDHGLSLLRPFATLPSTQDSFNLECPNVLLIILMARANDLKYDFDLKHPKTFNEALVFARKFGLDEATIQEIAKKSDILSPHERLTFAYKLFSKPDLPSPE